VLCFRCGNANPPNLNYCGRCNAVLPRLEMDDASLAPPLLDLEEGRQYLVPTQSFPTEYLYQLTCRAYEYVHEEASGTPLLEAYELVRSKIDAFDANELPGLIERLQNEKKPDDDYSSQMIYLLTRGVATMREGFELMDAFVENGDVETLRAALARMQQGNDHLGLGKRLSSERAGMR